ncbi:hypothetical protein MJO28_010414 [Puccinia striiformis f. sp. tritici]|uniref:Uncharacterized protein n=1 Tax=Puccinia striiformis f. sp. tritici TaxID=168172 RepID=A0ACC0E6J3_9BASI|nr:hypothetical protein MJO28_010414 [Puccinia striiformis f. sp. tritici]
MLPANLLRRIHIALTVFITLIAFHSNQIAAETRERCGVGFQPSDDDPLYYVLIRHQLDHDAYPLECRSDDNVRHICKLDTCGEGGHPWKDFTFKDCEEFGASDITGRPPQTFHVAHYHADNSRNGRPQVSMVSIISALGKILEILTHAGPSWGPTTWLSGSPRYSACELPWVNTAATSTNRLYYHCTFDKPTNSNARRPIYQLISLPKNVQLVRIAVPHRQTMTNKLQLVKRRVAARVSVRVTKLQGGIVSYHAPTISLSTLLEKILIHGHLDHGFRSLGRILCSTVAQSGATIAQQAKWALTSMCTISRLTIQLEQFCTMNFGAIAAATGINGLYYECTFDKPTDFNARRPSEFLLLCYPIFIAHELISLPKNLQLLGKQHVAAQVFVPVTTLQGGVVSYHVPTISPATLLEIILIDQQLDHDFHSPVCRDDGNMRHKCTVDSCTEGNHPWKDFMFRGCKEQTKRFKSTGNNNAEFHVLDFKADNTARTITAAGTNGYYYDCTFDKPTDFNARRPTCTKCNPPRSDDD